MPPPRRIDYSQAERTSIILASTGWIIIEGTPLSGLQTLEGPVLNETVLDRPVLDILLQLLSEICLYRHSIFKETLFKVMK